ncbi:MAG: NUDIX hydrolase [Thermoanaerobaculia bacterium]
MDHQISAGGLVVRAEEVLLISTAGGRRWQLPKGHIEAGETARETAEREVREETGVTGRVVAQLPEIEYWFFDHRKKHVHKRVIYFLLRYLEGDTSDYDRHEVSGAAWFGWEKALAQLTFENEREVVTRARELLAQDPALLIPD